MSKMEKRKYIRTDKNGTKIYNRYIPCERCGGSGYTIYTWVDGGICFDCGGSGEGKWIEEKEYTPEYEAKLTTRRAARQAKKDEEAKAKAVEANREFFERQGFNEEGKMWAVLGNTYSIKEELKSKGARWMNFITRWTFNHPVEEYPTVELNADDIYDKDHTFTYRWNYYKSKDDETFSKKIKDAEANLARNDSTSEWFGEVGKRYDLSLIFVRTVFIENSYAKGYWSNDYSYIHIFKDEKGNEYTWKTGSSMPDAVEGMNLSVKGTVKEHKEYRGKKQTVLTRCKVTE